MNAHPNHLFRLLSVTIFSFMAAIAQAAPPGVNIAEAEAAAANAARTQAPGDIQAANHLLVQAKIDAGTVYNVESLLRVASAFQRIKNDNEAAACLELAYINATKWARYDGAEPRGADYLYGRDALQNVANAQVKLPDGWSVNDLKGWAKNMRTELDAEMAKGAPNVFGGDWFSSSSGRITSIRQFGAGLSGSNNRVEFTLTIHGVQNDVVTAAGTFNEIGTTRHGTISMSINLRQSNVLNSNMTFMNTDGTTSPAGGVSLSRP